MSDDKKSGILTLTVTDTDPNRVAAIANAYTEELDQSSADPQHFHSSPRAGVS